MTDTTTGTTSTELTGPEFTVIYADNDLETLLAAACDGIKIPTPRECDYSKIPNVLSVTSKKLFIILNVAVDYKKYIELGFTEVYVANFGGRPFEESAGVVNVTLANFETMFSRLPFYVQTYARMFVDLILCAHFAEYKSPVAEVDAEGGRDLIRGLKDASGDLYGNNTGQTLHDIAQECVTTWKGYSIIVDLKYRGKIIHEVINSLSKKVAVGRAAHGREVKLKYKSETYTAAAVYCQDFTEATITAIKDLATSNNAYLEEVERTKTAAAKDTRGIFTAPEAEKLFKISFGIVYMLDTTREARYIIRLFTTHEDSALPSCEDLIKKYQSNSDLITIHSKSMITAILDRGDAHKLMSFL